MGQYLDRLEKSTDYTNLNDAKTNLETIKSNFEKFISTINRDVSGNVVDNEYKTKFNTFKINLGVYVNKLQKIIDKLKSNAGDGDSVLLRWEQEAAANKELASTTSGVSSDTVKHRGNKGHISYVTKNSVSKVVRKVESANIGNNGYIEVHTKIETSVYQTTSLSSQSVSDVLNNGEVVSTSVVEGQTMYYNFNNQQIAG